MIQYECGCVNDVDPLCFAQFNISKCHFHKRHQQDVGDLGRNYYEKLGIDPANKEMYERQFMDGFGQLPSSDGRSIIEIGCGTSPYVNLFTNKGWEYIGLDPSLFACEWMTDTYDVFMIRGKLEDQTLAGRAYRAVLSAHSLEHMPDPRAALTIMHRILDDGGNLYLLIPDDTDLWNPDHLWFFSPATIRRLLEQIGFEIVSLNLRRHTDVENYIYITARKP